MFIHPVFSRPLKHPLNGFLPRAWGEVATFNLVITRYNTQLDSRQLSFALFKLIF